jgi:hypothetical protein
MVKRRRKNGGGMLEITSAIESDGMANVTARSHHNSAGAQRRDASLGRRGQRRGVASETPPIIDMVEKPSEAATSALNVENMWIAWARSVSRSMRFTTPTH